MIKLKAVEYIEALLRGLFICPYVKDNNPDGAYMSVKKNQILNTAYRYRNKCCVPTPLGRLNGEKELISFKYSAMANRSCQ